MSPQTSFPAATKPKTMNSTIKYGSVPRRPSSQCPKKYPMSGPNIRMNGMAVNRPTGRNHRPASPLFGRVIADRPSVASATWARLVMHFARRPPKRSANILPFEAGSQGDFARFHLNILVRRETIGQARRHVRSVGAFPPLAIDTPLVPICASNSAMRFSRLRIIFTCSGRECMLAMMRFWRANSTAGEPKN